MEERVDNFSESVSNMELLERAKLQFNGESKIVIKTIPKNVTEQDIHAFMQEFSVRDVTISKQMDQAIVMLEDGAALDAAVSRLNDAELQGQHVTVCRAGTDNLLCIANLPPDLPEYRFRELVTVHGTVDKCFLMRSEETGESKGYGFVEYSEPIEKIGAIKVKLDGEDVGGHTVHCDAITDTTPTGLRFSDLHSTCLVIDNLPPDFKESMDLRTIFSQPNRPVYCQIVTKESESLGFGVIEYEEAREAEVAYSRLRDHSIAGVNVNLAYCIPGKSAVHVVNRILFKYGDTIPVRKSSLLPDPVYPNPAFLNHPFFKSLVAKMPKLLVQFTEQLLHLQDGYVHNLENKTNAKPGILGPAPNIPMSPLMDVSLQLGLMALIALDQKLSGSFKEELPESMKGVRIPTAEDSQSKAESLLGDPMTAQANIVLKNLLCCTEKSEFGAPKQAADEPKLLGKPVHSFNMVYLTSFGRLMAMSSEKTQQKGLLGTGPPEPLMDKVVTSSNPLNNLLGSLVGRMGGNMNTHPANRPGNTGTAVNGNMGKFSNMGNTFGNVGPNIGNIGNQLRNTGAGYQQQRELQRVLEGLKPSPEGRLPSLLGLFPNAKGDSRQGLLGDSPAGNQNQAAQFMTTVQSLALQKLSADQQGNPQQILNALFSNKVAGSGELTTLLRNLGAQTEAGGAGAGRSALLETPPPLMGGHGDGLMPTPTQADSRGYGNSNRTTRGGTHSGYNDAGNQGQGFHGAGAGNTARGDGYNSMGGGGNYGGGQGQPSARQGRVTPARQQSLLGPPPQYATDNQGNNNEDDENYQSMADQAAAYAAQTDAHYNDQYSGYGADYSSGYNTGYHDYTDTGYRGSEQNRGSGSGQGFGGSSTGYGGSTSGYGGSMSGYGGSTPGYSGSSSSYSDSTSSYGRYGDSTSGYGGSGSGPTNNGANYKGSYSGYGDDSLGTSYSAGGGVGTGTKRGPESLRYEDNNLYGANTPSRASSGDNVPSLMGKYGGNKTTFGYVGSGMGTAGLRQGTMGPPLPPPQHSLLGTPPQGQKRGSMHMLPSPEPSPEGNYIGQHSQGLGGHYAESYVKRQKLNNLFSGHS